MKDPDSAILPLSAAAAPTRPAVIAVCNQKGGVGKTTTATNLAVCLAAYGARVVVMDFDSQGNASQALGAPDATGPGTYDLLAGRVPMPEALRRGPVLDVSLLAATKLLAMADIEASFLQEAFTNLKQGLKELGGRADLVIIDCPPTLGASVVNAIAVADSLLVPVTNDRLALEGLKRTWRLATQVRQGLDATSGVLLVGRSEPETPEALEARLGAELAAAAFTTPVPTDLRVVAAVAQNLPACLYDPAAPAAWAYFEIAEEFLHRLRRKMLLPTGFQPHPKTRAAETLHRWHQAAAPAHAPADPPFLDEGVPNPPPEPAPREPRVTRSLLVTAVLLAFALGILVGGVLGLTPPPL